MRTIILILALAVFFMGVHSNSAQAAPIKHDWTSPEHSGGGDDDEPIKASAPTTMPITGLETPSRLLPDHPALSPLRVSLRERLFQNGIRRLTLIRTYVLRTVKR